MWCICLLSLESHLLCKCNYLLSIMKYYNSAEALTFFLKHFTHFYILFFRNILFLPFLHVLLFDLCKTQFGVLPVLLKRYETQLKNAAQLIKQYYKGGSFNIISA